ncbi:MAG: chorismate synthase [Dehalococcoidia bacterium]|jgi:chorismate synthase|nr:chorismate synthase [Dehalococcoidia bacterium]
MLRFLTGGESHGRGLVAVVEGMVAGLPFTREHITRDLARRRAGFGRGPRMALEADSLELLSGIRYGLTLGSPIAVIIDNKEWEEWQRMMAPEPVEQEEPPITRLRPGHADLAGTLKYGWGDVRPVLERASARETAARVAAGSIARRLLNELSMEIYSHTVAIGGVKAERRDSVNWEAVEASPLRCADPKAEKEMVASIESAREVGDSVGGVFEVIAIGVPVGLGSHVHWDRRLDGLLAGAVMSIPALKGVEVGLGFAASNSRGSQVHDIILPPSGERGGPSPFPRASNCAGGIEGGMSNGQEIVMRCAVKPIPTLANPLPSVDLLTGREVQAHHERSDVCAVPSAGVVAEAMVALVLAGAFLDKFGGDSLEETRRSYNSFLRSLGVGD